MTMMTTFLQSLWNMKILKLSSTTRPFLHTDPFSKRNDTTLHQGGDGTYKVTNDEEKLVQVTTTTNLTLKAKEIGRASIKIEDSSNNMYILSVVVKYRTLTHRRRLQQSHCEGRRAYIQEEHTELMNKVGNSYPINKYVFTFMNAEDSKGT